MDGDNLYVSIELLEHKTILFSQNWVLRKLIKFKRESMVSQKKLTKEEDDQFIPNISYNEFLLDYPNDFNVPANIGVIYYGNHETRMVNIISVTAMNHPAGELMVQEGVNLCQEFDDSLVKSVILTNDSPYFAPEIIKRFNEENFWGLGVVHFITKNFSNDGSIH